MGKRILFSILIILVVLEAGLRISGGFYVYSEIIGHGFSKYYGKTYESWFWANDANVEFVRDHGDFKFLYKTNSFGYREHEPGWDHDNNIRLLAFGDSHTEGVGAELEESWPHQLTQKLVADLDSTAEVLNFGASGSDPFYNMMELRERAISLEPTHVIFMVNHSDLEDFIYRGGMDRFKPDSMVINKAAPWFLPLYRYSHVVRFATHRLFKYDAHMLRKKQRMKIEMEARDALLNCFRDAEALCKTRNSKFMVVFMPMVGWICSNKDGKETAMERVFTNDYAFNNIHLAAPTRDYFKEVGDCREFDYYWPNDGHYNAKGYGIFTDLLYQAISDKYPEFWHFSELNQTDQIK